MNRRTLILIAVLLLLGLMLAILLPPRLQAMKERWASETEAKEEQMQEQQFRDSMPANIASIHRSHRTSASGEALLLHLTWFAGWDVQYECEVTVRGSEVSEKALSLSERKRFYPQWTEAELDTLKSALKLLPQPPSQPALERCVFVSYLDGAEWRSLIYDRASLPPEVLAIYKLANEPIQPWTAPAPEKTPH